jgi:hypothetical protein
MYVLNQRRIWALSEDITPGALEGLRASWTRSDSGKPLVITARWPG